MKTKKVKEDTRPRFKIQLDSKTTIIVRSMNAFKNWKDRYPEAKLIQ
jgi:hypothetical protein